MRSLAVIIGNPAARGASHGKFARASALLQSAGFDAELCMTERQGQATLFAREWAAKNPSLIIAAGGDGTINEVMNGMAGSDAPLAILPLGTTNVLAKEVGVSEHIDDAVRTAVSGRPKKISLGRIEAGEGAAKTSRYFCLMAGMGFDGKAVHDINLSIKKISGKGAYILSGFQNFLHYSPGEIVCDVDGKRFRGYLAVISKASKYGGHFRVSPDASLLDPAFYACIFRGARRSDLLRYVFGVIRGRHLQYEDVVYVRAQNIEVLSRTHVQIDGDYFGLSPASLSVAKDVVNLVYAS